MTPSPSRSKTSQASSLFASVQALALRRNPGRGASSTPSTHEVNRNPSPATSIKIGDVQQQGGISTSQLHSFCSIDPTPATLEHAAADARQKKAWNALILLLQLKESTRSKRRARTKIVIALPQPLDARASALIVNCHIVVAPRLAHIEGRRWEGIARLAAGPDLDAAARGLVELVRLSSGALPDDVAVVLCREVAP
jgi:hypothetical protein